MILFTNFIYLLMTIKPKEINKYMKKSLISICVILLYHLAGVYVLGSSYSNVICVLLAIIIVVIFFYYIKSVSLGIDTIAVANQREAASVTYDELESLVEEGKVEEVRSNTIISLDREVSDDLFDFETSLEDTFNYGNSAEMSSAINHTNHQKSVQMGGRKR